MAVSQWLGKPNYCGGCTEEEANFLNGRSLMTLASGISHGYGCVLFPEGPVIIMHTCYDLEPAQCVLYWQQVHLLKHLIGNCRAFSVGFTF